MTALSNKELQAEIIEKLKEYLQNCCSNKFLLNHKLAAYLVELPKVITSRDQLDSFIADLPDDCPADNFLVEKASLLYNEDTDSKNMLIFYKFPFAECLKERYPDSYTVMRDQLEDKFTEAVSSIFKDGLSRIHVDRLGRPQLLFGARIRGANKDSTDTTGADSMPTVIVQLNLTIFLKRLRHDS